MQFLYVGDCVDDSSLKFVPELVLILFITIDLWLKMLRSLNLIIVLKQQFTKLIIGRSQTN